MKTIGIALLMVVSLAQVAGAMTYEERTAVAIAQNQAEIQRRHDLEVEKEKVAVLGKLAELSAPKISMNVTNENFTTVKTTQNNN